MSADGAARGVRGDERVTECADDLLTSVENFVSYTVTERCSQLPMGAVKQLYGQFEREMSGWWATLDSNQ